MAVRPILRMGHPLLLQRAAPVTEFSTPALQTLIADMLATQAAANGIGLAAPQIGVSQRVVVFGGDDNPRYPGRELIPATVLINPHIVPLAEDQEGDWEACLSVPGLRGWVPRYRQIHYSGVDANGAPIDRQVSGFHARVVQHECDHVEGILYPQRMLDLRRFGFEQELLAASSLTAVS